MRLPRPFIRLPLRFDAQRLADECRLFPDSAWMAHPSGLAGNDALALVSREGGDNDDFYGRMAPAPRLADAPYLAQVMASFDEVIGRSRLMRLGPGHQVSPHVDFNYHWVSRIRIHIPIITEPEVLFACGPQQVHMRAGECWIFDSWRRHQVTHGGRTPRIHLVIDTAGSSRFWRGVRELEAIDPVADRAAIEQRVREVPFDPDARPVLRTEQHNMPRVMSPGELDALVRDLVDDFSACARNNASRVAHYRELLADLCFDWRETWHLHGETPAGWPRYRALLDRVHKGMHPGRRALVTASNDVGVNPIIVQRILRAALNVDDMPAASKD